MRFSASFIFSFYSSADHRDLHSFPTRRSSDLGIGGNENGAVGLGDLLDDALDVDAISGQQIGFRGPSLSTWLSDRKSTRLNSSHTVISYAVFCLKKKTSRQARRVGLDCVGESR